MLKFISFDRIKKIAELIMAIALIYFVYDSCNQRKERKIYEQNQTNFFTSGAREIQLTKNELKNYIKSADSALGNRLDKMGIKEKNVTNIVQSSYRFKDTTITSTILNHDYIRDRSYFNFLLKCWGFSGYVQNDSLFVTNKELKDKLTLVQYKDWEHRWKLFRKAKWDILHWGKFYSSQLWSDCKNDTVPITRNIKIR